jgi:hypothetical protein
LNARTSASDIFFPAPSSCACFTCASTDAACSPPITLIRLFGHMNRKRGW